MRREIRTIKRFSNETGTLSESNIAPAQVRFSLTVTREFLDGLPMLMDGSGTIQFIDQRRAMEFFSSHGSATLKSANVQAEILVTTPDEFVTTGPVIYAGAPTN